MAQVTIIVPVYKVEKYLRNCFESLLKQPAEDTAILAINDGSPDGCGAIIREYVERYPDRIAGIEKDNGGYGSVLSLAIHELKTPYFLICDPDDTLAPDAVRTLLDLARLSGADICIGAKVINREGSEVREYDSCYNKEFVTLKANTVYNHGTPEFDDLFFVNPSPHAKLYRREMAQSIRFPEKVGYTDNLLFYICLLNSRKVIYTDKPLAEYLIDRAGNTMTDISIAAMNGQILVFKTLLTQASKIRDVPDIFWYRMFESFKFMLYDSRRMNCSKEEYEEVLNYLGTFVQKLCVYQKQIAPYYKKYAKTKFLEKIRDENLMNPGRFDSAYRNLVKKMMSDYAPEK